MSIIITLIIGLIAGALAKALLPGRQGGGILVTMLLGVAGSLVTGALGHMLGWYSTGEGPGIIASALGAMAVLLIYGATRSSR